MREIECKFRVHAPFEIPPLTETESDTGPRTGVFGMDELTRSQLSATYYDTVDVRLAREGITLRYRTGGYDDGWHLKLPVLDATREVRDEIQMAGDPGAVPAELRELVTVYLRHDQLAPVATLNIDRTTYVLRDASGVPLAELPDDLVAARSGTLLAARFREIEVEDRGGATQCS